MDTKDNEQFTPVKRVGSTELDQLHQRQSDVENLEYDTNKTFNDKTIESREKTPARQITDKWATFMAETSCHGMKIVGNLATPIIIRIFYVLVMLIVVVSMYITVVQLAATALKYRPVTRTEVFVNLNMTFPTITFCNMCPYSFRGKNESDLLFLLLAKQSMYGQLMPDVDFNESDAFRAFFHRTIADLYEEYSMTIGLLHAEYEGENLDKSAFEPLDTDHGRCYQFNGPEYMSRHGARRATSHNRKSGLRAVLNISQDDYGIFDDITAGLRMYISHPDSVPVLETHGLHMMPGTSSLVGISLNEISFLPSPYRSYGSELCVDSPDLVAKMKIGNVYSFESCRSQCVLYKTSMACQCYMPDLVLADLRPCTAWDLFFGCYKNVSENILAHIGTECDCPRPCSVTFYEVHMSMSQMPSKVALKPTKGLFNITDEAHIRDNILEVRVFFDSPLVRIDKHEPEFTLDSFLSSLGGQMGIYLGASVITLLEFLEMIVYTFYAAVRWLSRRLYAAVRWLSRRLLCCR